VTHSVKKRFNLQAYFWYKALNSAFTGLSIGIFFVLYTPLKPITYSIGGIILALGMLVLAKLYTKVLNYNWFFRFSLLVEIVMLLMIIVVLFGGFSLFTAMAVYSGYQVSFMFGGYLLRVESLVLKRSKILEAIDVAKQIGYMVGLAFSYGFYEFFHAYNSQEQVYSLHYLMVSLEVLIIVFLLRGFKKIMV